MAVSTKTMRSALAAAGVAAVTGGILLVTGVQREIAGSVAGTAGIAAGIFKRKKSKIVREVSENNVEATEGEGLYSLAVSEFEAGNYANAVGLFSQVLELNKESAEAYHLRGYSWGELGQWSEQIEDYSKAIEIGGIDDDLYFNRGVAYFNAELYESAISDFTRSLESRPENTTGALINRGSTWFYLHKYEEARQDFTSAIDLDADNSDAYFNRARAYQEGGDIHNAISDFDSAIRIDPQNIDYIIDRGIAWEQLGEKEKAIRDFANAISIKPDSYRAHLLRGTAERDIGRLDNAIRDFTRAIEIAPTLVEAIKERGFTHGKAGNAKLAIDDYTTAIDLEPQNAVLHYCRGLWKRESLDLEGALIDLNHSTDLDPEYPNPYRTRAGIQLEEGRYTDAIDELSRISYYRDLINRITSSLDEAEVIGRKSEIPIIDAENSEQRSRFSETIEEICSELVLDPLLAQIVCGYSFKKTNNKSAALAHLRVIELTASVEIAILQCIEYKEVFSDKMIVNYLERLGGAPSVITYLERLLQENSQDTELSMPDGDTRNRSKAKLYSRKALYNRALGKLENSLADAENAVLFDKNKIYLNDLGIIQQELGLYRESISSFTEAFSLAPEDVFILTNRANTKSLSGDLEGALNDYTQAIERGDGKAYYKRAYLQLNQLKDYHAAIEDFTSAIDCDACGDKHHYYYNRAYTKSLMGDLEGVLRDCDLALGIDPEYVRPIRLKAKTCYELGDLCGAKELYLRILELGDPDLIDYQELGSIEDKLETFDAAIRYLQHSNQINMHQSGDPSDLETFYKSSYYLAHSLYRIGDYEEALTVTKECEKHVDIDAEFLRLTACIYDDSGDSKKAIETINKALALDGTIPAIWYDRGVIKRDSGDLEGAIADFKQAFALDSSFISACHNTGSSYMKTGNMTQACYYWKMASDLGDQDSKRLMDEYCGEE